MNTIDIGLGAEATVANFLADRGYSIIARNWKTKACEIDIIAKMKKTIYFVEVKYRAQSMQGSGFEYIGSQKIRKLKFASELWVQLNNWGGDYRLLGAEVSGQGYEAISLTELD